MGRFIKKIIFGIGLTLPFMMGAFLTDGAETGKKGLPGFIKQNTEGEARRMDNTRLESLIRRIDPEADGKSGFWKLTVENHALTVITDETADRMRIIMPIEKIDDLDRKRLYRLMQANFDSALDARYSIAKNKLWSTFIHPLSPLGDEEFLSGIGQVVNLGATYGTSYSSGALLFGGGDSKELQQRELIDRLIQKGTAL